MPKRVAVVGLGDLGSGVMARLQGDRLLSAIDPAESARAPWVSARGVTVAADIASASWADVERVHVLVRTHQQADAVMEELDLNVENDTPVHVHTTLAPRDAAGLMGRPRRSVRALEQPITGGAAGFRTGTVTILSAGPTTQADRDWISRIAARIVDFDHLGHPTLAKLVNNTIAAVITRATVDLLTAATGQGLPLESMRAVLRHGSGGSWMAEAVAGLGEDQARLLVKDVRLLQEQVGPLPSLRLDDEDALLTGLAAFKTALADTDRRR